MSRALVACGPTARKSDMAPNTLVDGDAVQDRCRPMSVHHHAVVSHGGTSSGTDSETVGRTWCLHHSLCGSGGRDRIDSRHRRHCEAACLDCDADLDFVVRPSRLEDASVLMEATNHRLVTKYRLRHFVTWAPSHVFQITLLSDQSYLNSIPCRERPSRRKSLAPAVPYTGHGVTNHSSRERSRDGHQARRKNRRTMGGRT